MYDRDERDIFDIYHNEDLKGYVEGYAQALSDMMSKLSGETPSSKSYDPLTVDTERLVVHSYAKVRWQAPQGSR